MQIGSYGDEAKIEDLVVNRVEDMSSFLEEYIPTSTVDTLKITYSRDYEGKKQFKMVYPETFEATY